MKQYIACAQHLLSELVCLNFEKVPREQITKADMLSKLSAREPIERTWIESLLEKSISKDICMINVVKNWTTPIREFILHEKLPDDQIQARNV